MSTVSTFNLSDKLNRYFEEVKYKLAFRLSLLFTIIFALLTVAHYYESIENFITMMIGFFICLVCFTYTALTRNHQLVYWVFSILGVTIVGIALNFLPRTTHYGDFIWIFSANALAFFALDRKVAYALTLISLGFIAFFTFGNVNTHIELLQPRTSFQKFSLFAEVSAGLVSGIYLIYLIVQFYNFSQKILIEANAELQNQNQLIKAQDEEKTLLMKEVHHRVKNNLQIIASLLRMQSNEIRNEESKAHFQEAINRVMSMSLIHQKLYQGNSLSDIDLKNYFQDLTSELLALYDASNRIDMQFHIDRTSIGLKSIVPLGLLFNELVSNSLNHAFDSDQTGAITVSITEVNKTILFKYGDTGTWKESLRKGFGQELIGLLVEQMEGTFELQKNKEKTEYLFSLKISTE